MTREVFLAEIKAVTKQIEKHCKELTALPFNAEPHVREEIERRSRLSEAKHELIIKESNKRGLK